MAISDDLATGDIKWRLAKIVFEKIARGLGLSLGESGPARQIANFLKSTLGDSVPAEWTTSAIGILAAALLQSPEGLARAVAKYTGQDPAKLDELFNEALDSAVLGFSTQLQNPLVSDSELRTAVDQKSDKLNKQIESVERNKDQALKKQVAVLHGILHDPGTCWEILGRKAKRNGSMGFDPDGKRKSFNEDNFIEGVRIITLGEALKAGYDPLVQPHCCGGVKKTYDELLKRPLTLFAVIEGFKTSSDNELKAARVLFNKAQTELTQTQTELLHDIGTRVVWTAERVSPNLLQAVKTAPDRLDVDLFLRLLSIQEKPATKPIADKARGWLERNVGDLFKDQEKLEREHPEHDLVEARKAIAKYTEGVRKQASALRTKQLRRQMDREKNR